MIATAISLIVFVHGSPAEKPVVVMDFTRASVCAQAMGPVQAGLRFDWPHAITACRVTGAPLASLRPVSDPRLQ